MELRLGEGLSSSLQNRKKQFQEEFLIGRPWKYDVLCLCTRTAVIHAAEDDLSGRREEEEC